MAESRYIDDGFGHTINFQIVFYRRIRKSHGAKRGKSEPRCGKTKRLAEVAECRCTA
jgi:hypothetical protein